MFGDEGYTTPEGFWLPRRILLPDARRFDEVLTFVRPWDHATMTHTSGRVPSPGLVPEPVKIGENEVGPFCSLRCVPGHRDHSSMAVVATQATIDVLAPRLVTDDDRLSFEVIYHADRNRCLIIAQHGYIIGSHHLAYIDPATVPTFDKD